MGGVKIDYEYALFSIKRALLEEITPNLRAVTILLDTNNELTETRLYYDGFISEELRDIASCIIFESNCDFPFEENSIEEILRLDAPKEIPIRGSLAYLRKEKGITERKRTLYNPQKLKKEIQRGCYKLRVFAVLAAQSALLGAITPNIRLVEVIGEDETKEIEIKFYFHGPISTNHETNVKEVISRMLEDCQPEYSLKYQILRLDYPEKIIVQGDYVYERKERNVLFDENGSFIDVIPAPEE